MPGCVDDRRRPWSRKGKGGFHEVTARLACLRTASPAASDGVGICFDNLDSYLGWHYNSLHGPCCNDRPHSETGLANRVAQNPSWALAQWGPPLRIVCNNSVENEKVRSLGTGIVQGANNFIGNSLGPFLPQVALWLLYPLPYQ